MNKLSLFHLRYWKVGSMIPHRRCPYYDCVIPHRCPFNFLFLFLYLLLVNQLALWYLHPVVVCCMLEHTLTTKINTHAYTHTHPPTHTHTCIHPPPPHTHTYSAWSRRSRILVSSFCSSSNSWHNRTWVALSRYTADLHNKVTPPCNKQAMSERHIIIPLHCEMVWSSSS